MTKITLAVSAILLAGLTAVYADEKNDDTKKKLVGVWKLTKGDGPMGATVEFTQDDKVKIVTDADGKKKSIAGTYQVTSESLVLILKSGDGKERKETMKIKNLTEKELSWEDEKGKADEFKKQP